MHLEVERVKILLFGGKEELPYEELAKGGCPLMYRDV
jgi:hypothetical protein